MTRLPQSESPSSARIRIRLLGPVAVEVDGSPLAVDTRKAVALLAYLAVTRRPASRESAAALLWPDADGPDARGALRRTLSVLNAGLGSPGLVVDRSAISLDPSAFEVDLWRFEEALGVARGHDHPGAALCPTCLEALQTAAVLDRGEFMAGFALRDSEEFDEWQLAEATSHRRELAAVLERLARGQAAARAWESAAPTARRWLELDQLHEPAHRLLMEVLARSGEPGAALAQYRDCVRILDRELGVAPLTETTDLAETIRAGQLTVHPSIDLSVAEDAVVPRQASGIRQVNVLGPGPTKRPLLVGRDREIRVLIGILDQVGPSGRLLVIEGEPGIGKTRLAMAVADVVRDRGGAVLEARGYAGEAAIPLSVIAELLRSGMALPDAADRLTSVDPGSLAEVTRLLPIPGIRTTATPSDGDPFGRVRLFEALASVLTALVRGPRRGLVWIDDLHLADASTLEFLGYLTRRLPDHALWLAVTWRVEDLESGVRERILEVASQAGLATRVSLGRLDRSDVASLVGAVLGEPATVDRIDSLFEESEGLPLYVIEALAEHGSDRTGTPGGMQALLRARTAAVSEVGRQVLAAAAVIGRSFDPALVRVASGRSDDETVEGLEELIRRGLVREVESVATDDLRLDFTHARLRDVVYEGLSLARRRLLHGRVAAALAGTPSVAREGRVRWSLIAYHETLAGRSEAAAEAHRRAGDHARSVFANDEAREHLEAALALGHPAKAELHAALGEVLTLLGDYEGALFHLASAAALAGPDDQAVLEFRQGLVHARRGGWSRADHHLTAALASTDDGAMRSRILGDRSAIAERSGDPAGAERLAREALALAEAVDDPAGIARSLDLLGILARRRGDLASARANLERAIAVVDASESGVEPVGVRDPSVQIAALNTLALVLSDEGDHERAIALTREALVRCERQGDRHRQAALENNLADLLHATGQADEAMQHLKRAVSIFAEVGGRPGELEPEIWKLVEW
jgi:DNA-binding SARP family transcriptional activator/tetratricopeptide (TPR) repeat protein